MAAPRRPRQGEKIVKATWVDQAVTLAIKGWSTRRIAKKVNRHHSTVAEALNAEFERVRPSESDVHRYRGVMGEQLDEQIAAWCPRSLKGDKDAALAVVRFQDRKAKLYGLDAAVRNEHTGANGGPMLNMDLDTLSEQQLEAFAAGGYAALAGASAAGTPPAPAGRSGTEGSG
jgi:hypothetical protein